MKKILGFYVSRTLPTPAPVNNRAELDKAARTIKEEYEAAKSRQKNPEGAPSQYMRGLSFSLAVLEAL